jgi:hypothetical protein
MKNSMVVKDNFNCQMPLNRGLAGILAQLISSNRKTVRAIEHRQAIGAVL